MTKSRLFFQQIFHKLTEVKYKFLSDLNTLIIPVILITVCGCGKESSNQDKKVFNINLNEGLTSLDPAFARNQNALWMINQLFNGLVQVNDSLKTVPAIAKSWEMF